MFLLIASDVSQYTTITPYVSTFFFKLGSFFPKLSVNANPHDNEPLFFVDLDDASYSPDVVDRRVIRTTSAMLTATYGGSRIDASRPTTLHCYLRQMTLDRGCPDFVRNRNLSNVKQIIKHGQVIVFHSL